MKVEYGNKTSDIRRWKMRKRVLLLQRAGARWKTELKFDNDVSRRSNIAFKGRFK